MPVDNELYNRLADTWWDDANPLSLLLTMVTPARFGYFRGVLIDRLKIDPHGKRVLDIGCGGSFLAEEFARLGCQVVGVDPSAASLETARAHARISDLDIAYRVGVGEHLPCDDESFDIVYCCDVLEHVNDLDKVIAETVRVLKPGGVYFYDTINRTLQSKILAIKVMQEWTLTRIFDTPIHDWSMFITPPELLGVFARHGLQNRALVGLTASGSPLALLRSLRKMKRGAITPGGLGRRITYVRSGDLSVSYMGYAIRGN